MHVPLDDVWVTILTTQPVVARGLQAILEEARAPFDIRIVEPNGEEPDVVLYDTIKLQVEDGGDLDHWLKETASVVIAIDRTLRPALLARARDLGVEWSIDLGVTAQELVGVIESAVAGDLEESDIAHGFEAPNYLEGNLLTRRESTVLALIVAGRSNDEMAEELFLSINSVKSYIRTAYRKMGVRGRGAAVSWAIERGFRSTPGTRSGRPSDG